MPMSFSRCNPQADGRQTRSMIRIMLALTLVGGLTSAFTPLVQSVRAEDGAPSILYPAQPNQPVYTFRIDRVDPTAETNPAAATVPGFRGEGQLILYTPAFGTSTGTNEAGREAVIRNGVITQTGTGNSDIPPDGYVLSGHGPAAQWMGRFAKTGAQAVYDAQTGQIRIQFTPQVYLDQVDRALARAQERPPASVEGFQRHFGEAQTCRAQLAAQQNQPVTTDMTRLAGHCEQEADLAFYNTSPARANEFRGTWIRPRTLDPAKIHQKLAELKQLGIQHIFLETYYQGETIFPSQTMAAYGLPAQHPEFRGSDPLQLWIDEAHGMGMKVHAWVQVFFAGNSRESAETYGPILHQYPQWRNVERSHLTQDTPVPSEIEPGHYFLDPANPDVRTFLGKLLQEVTTRYDVDGLNLDYIRYPASAPVTSGLYFNTTWGYTDAARARFQAQVQQDRDEAEQKRIEALKLAGKPIPKAPARPVKPPSSDPKDLNPKSPLWPRWISWRKEQVSTFVQGVSQELHARKPNVPVTAVVFPSSDPTYALKLQDYPRWTREGWVQALTPIGLSTIPSTMYRQSIMLKNQVPDSVPIYVGVFALYNRQEPVELIRQIDAIHQADMPGIVLFDGARLTPEYQETLREGPFRL